MKLILDSQELLKAPDYQGFLQVLYTTNKTVHSQFSYAYIAKQCQFSSKSFIKEVIDRKKQLSIESCHKLINGLALTALWKSYFLNLVRSAQVLTEAEKLKVQKELKRIRQKLNLEKFIDSKADDKNLNIFRQNKWPYVFAALGQPAKGATIEEISQRTGFGFPEIESVLKFLVTENLAMEVRNRYIAKENTSFFENLGQSDFFKNYYLQSLASLAEKSKKNFDNKNALYYTVSFSVNPTHMPKFRKELAELMDKFTSEAEDPDGTKIAELTCGLHLTSNQNGLSS